MSKQVKRGASQWNVAWRRFRKNRAALAGMFMIGVLLFVVISGDAIAPYPSRPHPDAFKPFYEGETSSPPSWEHLFGTASNGVDVFSEVIHGSRYAMYVAVVVTVVTMLIATVIGVIAGYFGKQIDNVLMRTTEVFLVFPSLLFILLLARIYQLANPSPFWDFPLGIRIPVGLTIVVFVISIFGWASNARLVRGEVMRIREFEFVQAVRALGASNSMIMWRHLLPNALSPVIVVASLQMANAILLEAGVSFLGFGDPNVTTWGLVLNENFNYISTTWWAEVFPGLAVLWSVLGFNLLGDGLSDALNPRLRQ